MELRQLEAFVAVAEEKNFSKAARRLHMSQPPLSRRVQQLEQELGVSLFTRTPQGATLTPEGEALLPGAKEVIVHSTNLQAAAGALSARVRVPAVVKVGFTGVGLTGGMWELVNLIRTQHSARSDSIELEGYEMRSSEQLQALQRRTIDVGFLRPWIDAVHLNSELLFRERIVVLLAADHPLARNKHVRLRDVANEVVLMNDTSPAGYFTSKISDLAAARGLRLEFRAVGGDPPERAALLPVAAGKGISFGVASPFTRVLDMGGIVVVPLNEPDATIDVRIVWRRVETRPEVLGFIRSVRAMFRGRLSPHRIASHSRSA